MARDQNQSTRSQQSNSPRAGDTRSADDARGSTPAAGQISAERKKYLATTYDYSQEQIDVVRNQICLSATDAELEFFLATCKRVRLDPFARQIYFIKRRQKIEDAFGNESWVDVGKPEASIDGFRASAEMTGEYRGQGPVMWCGPDGRWVDVWLEEVAPMAAKATIFRKDREPLVNVALFDEYAPKYRNGNLPSMWVKMPANQIAKCAEAGGLRRAFPRDLSGLYADVEVEHTSTDSTFTAPAAAKPANVIDAPSTETKQLDTGPAGPIAQLAVSERKRIDELHETIKNAKTRGDLAPVGAELTSTKKQQDPYAIVVQAEVRPALEAKWKTLPPEGARPRT